MNAFFWMGFLIIWVAGWVTHIVTCLVTAQWGFLIAGALFAPIGSIHGFLIWMGLA